MIQRSLTYIVAAIYFTSVLTVGITVGSRGGDLSTYTILTTVVLAFTVPLNFPFY